GGVASDRLCSCYKFYGAEFRLLSFVVVRLWCLWVTRRLVVASCKQGCGLFFPSGMLRSLALFCSPLRLVRILASLRDMMMVVLVMKICHVDLGRRDLGISVMNIATFKFAKGFRDI